MPPFKSGQRQFTSSENKYGYDVACVRIHIERVIQRMKIFDILHSYPVHLFKYADCIINVIAFITNLFTDIIKEK